MEQFLDQGSNEGMRRDGLKVIRFWAAADSWERATITVRVNYREWLAAMKDRVQIVEIGAERRFRPSNPGRGMILPHVEVCIYYLDAPQLVPAAPRGTGAKAKPVYPVRTCRYCGKTFEPKGSVQRYCDVVCRKWYELEEAEKSKNRRGLDRDQGV